jgi:hypothetical protein
MSEILAGLGDLPCIQLRVVPESQVCLCFCSRCVPTHCDVFRSVSHVDNQE